MSALEIANKIIAEMDSIIPDDVLLATGFRSAKEYVMGSKAGLEMFARYMISEYNCPDKAISAIAEWKASFNEK